MSNLQRFLLLAGGGLLLIALSIFILYPVFRSDEPVEVVQTTTNSPSQIQALPPNQPIAENETTVVLEPLAPESVEKDEATNRSQITQVARLFVERFGSYSNYNTDIATSLRSFMTSSMSSYADTVVAQIREENTGRPITDYLGISTRILSTKITSYSDQAATVEIIVQEERQEGINGDIQIVRKDGRVELINQAGQWLVNGLFYN